ncbi:Uncharacterised protein [uncultured archaeon]|nr:Uncharacterised protein [uncultured archaeon]
MHYTGMTAAKNAKAFMKGIFSPIVLAIGLAALIFIANSAVWAEQADRTLMKIEAAREISMKTENAMRIVDKSISDAIYDNRDDTSCKYLGNATQINTAINGALASLNGFGQVQCSIAGTNTITIQSNDHVNVAGTISCAMPIGGTEIKETRGFMFSKEIYKAGTCFVKDRISGCIEQPGFSC